MCGGIYQRLDYLHKKSYYLAEDYDAVYIETLNMQAMNRTLKFGKSAADDSFGKFCDMLDYKLYFRGKKLVKVDKSQLCSKCGHKNAQVKDLKV